MVYDDSMWLRGKGEALGAAVGGTGLPRPWFTRNRKKGRDKEKEKNEIGKNFNWIKKFNKSYQKSWCVQKNRTVLDRELLK